MPLLSAADLVTLPKGQAFALLDGGQLWKIRMPLPDVDDDRSLPKDVDAIVKQRLRDYMAQKTHACMDATLTALNG